MSENNYENTCLKQVLSHFNNKSEILDIRSLECSYSNTRKMFNLFPGIAGQAFSKGVVTMLKTKNGPENIIYVYCDGLFGYQVSFKDETLMNEFWSKKHIPDQRTACSLYSSKKNSDFNHVFE